MNYSEMSVVPFEGDTFTESEIAAFDEKYSPVIIGYVEAVKKKKAFEQQEKKFKEQLGKVMDELGIKSIDNEYLRITRVAAGADKTTIDIDAMQDKEPELYAELLADYPKTVKGRSAYVKFDVK